MFGKSINLQFIVNWNVLHWNNIQLRVPSQVHVSVTSNEAIVRKHRENLFEMYYTSSYGVPLGPSRFFSVISTRESTKTKTRNTFKSITISRFRYCVFESSSSYLRVFVFVLSCFHLRTWNCVFVFVLSCFRVLKLLNRNAMALNEHRNILC